MMLLTIGVFFISAVSCSEKVVVRNDGQDDGSDSVSPVFQVEGKSFLFFDIYFIMMFKLDMRLQNFEEKE